MSSNRYLLALCLVTLILSGCATAKRAWNWVWGEPRISAPIEPPPTVAAAEPQQRTASKPVPAATAAPATDLQQIPAEEIVGSDESSAGEVIDDSASAQNAATIEQPATQAAQATAVAPAATASAAVASAPELAAPMTQPSATAEPVATPAPAQQPVAPAQPVTPAQSAAPAQPVALAQPPAPAAETLTLQTDALFPFGKSDLTSLSSAGKQRLDALVARIKQLDPGDTLAINVTGHADRLGAPHRITLVAQQRAEAIKAYLAQQGIDASRITAIGRGASEPKALCQNIKQRSKLITCLAPDRRVEVSIAARP